MLDARSLRVQWKPTPCRSPLLTPSVGAGVVTRAFLTRIFTDSRRYPPDTTGADIVRTVDMLAQHDTGPHVTSRQSCRDGGKLRTWSLGL